MKKHDDSSLIEITTSTEPLYSGPIFDIVKRTVLLPNGKSASRDLLLHKGASAVVALDTNGNIAMVRQYRAALDCVLLEIPAGKLDSADEDPLLCAQRELREETGLTAQTFTKLTTLIPAAGYSSELIHIYLATDLRESAATPDDDEFLSFSWMPLSEATEMILRGEIRDSKTIAGVLLARERGGGGTGDDGTTRASGGKLF